MSIDINIVELDAQLVWGRGSRTFSRLWVYSVEELESSIAMMSRD